MDSEAAARVWLDDFRRGPKARRRELLFPGALPHPPPGPLPPEDDMALRADSFSGLPVVLDANTTLTFTGLPDPAVMTDKRVTIWGGCWVQALAAKPLDLTFELRRDGGLVCSRLYKESADATTRRIPIEAHVTVDPQPGNVTWSWTLTNNDGDQVQVQQRSLTVIEHLVP